MSKLILGVGQAHKLEQAFRRNDWTATEIDLLSQGDLLARIRQVVLGRAKIVPAGILKFLRKVAVGGTEKFIAADAFGANNPAGIKFFLGDNFKKFFLGKIEENVESATLNVHRLEKPSRNPEIMAELGAEKRVVKLAHFHGLIKAQANGQEGPLLISGYATVAYIEDDESGNLWAVCADWFSFNRGWFIGADSVGDPGGWGMGVQVLSRK